MDVALRFFKTNPQTGEVEQDGHTLYYRDNSIGVSALSLAHTKGERWVAAAPGHTYKIDRL